MEILIKGTDSPPCLSMEKSAKTQNRAEDDTSRDGGLWREDELQVDNDGFSDSDIGSLLKGCWKYGRTAYLLNRSRSALEIVENSIK